MRTVFTLFAIAISLNNIAQTSTFTGNEKNISIKQDTIPKKDSSFSERSMQRVFTRRGVSDQLVTKDDFTNVSYLYNGKKITLAEVDSITKNWDGVKCEDDISKRPIERTISRLSNEEFSKIAVGQKTEVSKKWDAKAIPDFNFTDIKGKSYSNNQLKGKIIVLNFWFIACGPCIKEMPTLNKLVDKYKSDENIIFLGLALDSNEEIKEFLKKREFKYSLIGNTENFTRGIMGISSWPTSMLIDKNGIVRFSRAGNNEEGLKLLEQRIAELLSK
jgi:thiol-disulfide isomerase/thioredoxin